MAQITIPETDFLHLTRLAALHADMTPEAYVAALLHGQVDLATDLERLDQREFWGPDIEARVAASLAELENQPRRIMTDEEFLADLRSRMKASPDADA